MKLCFGTCGDIIYEYIYICPVSSAYVQFTIGVTIKVVCIVRVTKNR